MILAQNHLPLLNGSKRNEGEKGRMGEGVKRRRGEGETNGLRDDKEH